MTDSLRNDFVTIAVGLTMGWWIIFLGLDGIWTSYGYSIGIQAGYFVAYAGLVFVIWVTIQASRT